MIMMIDQDLSDFLDHHGIKGQKWGVRRAREINVKRAAQGRRSLKPSQYVGNKATRGAAYVAAYLVGGAIGNVVGSKASGGNLLVSGLASTTGNVLGVVAANKALKRAGNKRVLDVLQD